MAKIPKRVAERFSKSIGRFQKVLSEARVRDVNESDTVTIITDILAGVFGYDKYSEITSEQAIRGTYCDLAVKIDGAVQFLIEVKAIGLTLQENHLRQAVGYGSEMGIPWVVLTNGIRWEIHRIRFEKPVVHELVCAFDMIELSPRKNEDHELLYLLCKEGIARAAIEDFHDHVQIVNRFIIGAIICSDPVLSVIRRELKRLAPEAKVTPEEVADLLPDILKRDVIEGEAAVAAKRRVLKAASKSLRKMAKKVVPAATQEKADDSA